MKIIITLAVLAITFTIALSYSIIPDFALYSLVWTAIGLFLFSQLLIFACLIVNTDRKTHGNPLNIGILNALGFYCLFSLIMVFAAPLMSGLTALLLSHFFVIIILYALVRGLMRVSVRSREATQQRMIARNAAEDKAEILLTCLHNMRSSGGVHGLAPQMDKIHFLAERIRLCRGNAPTEIDRQLDKELLRIQSMLLNRPQAGDVTELADKLNTALSDLEITVARRERYAKR